MPLTKKNPMSDAERKYHTATIQGQTAANIENYAETLRIQREEGQYAMHKQTQSANLGAYQIEKLTKMVTSGELLPNTLVWKQGMATWKKAKEVEDLEGLFPPPIE